MTVESTFNEKFLQMLHGSRGAVFSKSAPLAAGGKVGGGFRKKKIEIGVR